MSFVLIMLAALCAEPEADWLGAYLEFSEVEGLRAVSDQRKELVKFEVELERAKRGIIDPTASGVVIGGGSLKKNPYRFPSEESKTKYLEQRQQSFDEMTERVRRLRNEPYYAYFGNSMPEQKHVGRFKNVLRIEQVLGPSEVIITVFSLGGVGADGRVQTLERTYWVSGVDTSNMEDGKLCHLPQVFLVDGNKSYESESGAEQTIAQLRVVTAEELAAAAKRSRPTRVSPSR